ncbi:MAG: hypothetical protein ACXVA9_03550 [Bdellovibrionales bacterium]
MLRQILSLVLVAVFPLSALAQKCRQPGKSYNLEQANLPLCKGKTAATQGHKHLEEMRTTPEKWDELTNAEALPDDKPERTQYQAPARTRTPAATPARPVAGSRGPASVAPVARAPAAAVIPPANMSFDDYIAENARNPALSRLIPDHQKAFADTSAPAVITIPGSESATAAAAAAAAPAGAAGSQSAAIQAAAAAAGIALPAGTGSTTTPAAPAAGGPVR